MGSAATIFGYFPLNGRPNFSPAAVGSIPPSIRLRLLQASLWLFEMGDRKDLASIIRNILAPQLSSFPSEVLLSLAFVTRQLLDRGHLACILVDGEAKPRYPHSALIQLTASAKTFRELVAGVQRLFAQSADAFDVFLALAEPHLLPLRLLIEETHSDISRKRLAGLQLELGKSKLQSFHYQHQ